jgi:hypothetical protein
MKFYTTPLPSKLVFLFKTCKEYGHGSGKLLSSQIATYVPVSTTRLVFDEIWHYSTKLFFLFFEFVRSMVLANYCGCSFSWREFIFSCLFRWRVVGTGKWKALNWKGQKMFTNLECKIATVSFLAVDSICIRVFIAWISFQIIADM